MHQIFFAAVGQALPFILDGRVIGLAVTSMERSPVLPKVPTVAELGMPGFNYEVWFVIAAPGKTPKTVVNTLSTEVRRRALAWLMSSLRWKPWDQSAGRRHPKRHETY